MEIKFLYTLLFSICLAFPTFGAKKDEPQALTTFITSIENLAKISPSDVNKANELQFAIQYCFNSPENQGINIITPDIYLIGAHQDSNIQGQSYSIKLKQLIYDRSELIINHSIVWQETTYKPDAGKNIPHMLIYCVKEDISYLGKKSIVWQKIQISYENKAVINKINGSTIAFEKKAAPSKKDINNLSRKELHDLAAEHYTRKDYLSAYKTYLLLTEKYDSDAEGWYRLAIMTHDKIGCNIKHHKAKGKEYMRNAIERAKGDLLNKSQNVLSAWENENML